MLQAKKEFNQMHPKVKIAVSGVSSIVGPMSVKKGTAQIGVCDWDASKDVPGFKKFAGQVPNKLVAIPFTFVVHKNNPVTNLTTAQAQGIYKGTITNWNQVGGNNAPIVVVNRTFGSGTRVAFTDIVFGGMKNNEFVTGANAISATSSGNMRTAVEGNNENAIGFLDLVFVTGNVKSISYNSVAPTVANVINKTYPIWTYGYGMTAGNATGATKAFLDYVQSKKFQNGSVKKLKYIPVTAIK
jgi:phosphate transport system substrate-binding protein